MKATVLTGFSIILLIFFSTLLSAVPGSNSTAGVPLFRTSDDSLIIGKNYAFGTYGNRQYTGTLIGQDSVFFTILTDEGRKKIKRNDVRKYGLIDEKPDNIEVEASDSLKLVTVETKDGNNITGYILSRDSLNIILKTPSEIQMTIPVYTIVRITSPDIEYAEGKYFIKDPNETRLFLAPTGRTLSHGTGYISDVELFFPVAAIGLFNYVTIAGGISIIPFSENQLFYINAKVTPLKTKNLDLSAGYLFTNVTNSHYSGISLPYIVGTAGTKIASATFGSGIGFSEDGTSNPMFLLGGEIRVANNIKFLTENWIFTGESTNSFTFIGVRAFGAKFAGDFALLHVWETEDWNGWPFIPYVSITYNIDFN
ncbi:MAG: hypothetical protein MUE56_00405 [Ignavibacteria bacterium]|nr:hypothetical protein [Ignavibacteria bacterium]